MILLFYHIHQLRFRKYLIDDISGKKPNLPHIQLVIMTIYEQIRDEEC